MEQDKAQINSTRFFIRLSLQIDVPVIKHKLILQDSLFSAIAGELSGVIKHKLILQDSLFFQELQSQLNRIKHKLILQDSLL